VKGGKLEPLTPSTVQQCYDPQLFIGLNRAVSEVDSCWRHCARAHKLFVSYIWSSKFNNFVFARSTTSCWSYTGVCAANIVDDVRAGNMMKSERAVTSQYSLCAKQNACCQLVQRTAYTLRHCPSEADCRSAGHQIPRLFMELGNLIGIPSLQEPPMEPIVSQLNPSYRAYIPQPGWRNRTNPWQWGLVLSW